MDSFEQTVTAGFAWQPNHRHISVQKIENGFEVKANFLQTAEDYSGKRKQDWVSRTFCFYTDVEVLEFVKGYLNATPQKLGKEDLNEA